MENRVNNVCAEQNFALGMMSIFKKTCKINYAVNYAL